MKFASSYVHVFGQGSLGLVALAVLACSPPHSGSLLLVPLSVTSASTSIDAALAAGAAVFDRGPLPGSIVVKGDLARLRASTAGTDIVILAAPPAGCGPASDA